jgi:hypothetical protein
MTIPERSEASQSSARVSPLGNRAPKPLAGGQKALAPRFSQSENILCESVPPETTNEPRLREPPGKWHLQRGAREG